MKKGICLLLLSIMSFSLSAKDWNKVQPPKNIEVLNTSGTNLGVFITAIDLDNNEIVIMYYVVAEFKKGIQLVEVKRTGMFVPKEQ